MFTILITGSMLLGSIRYYRPCRYKTNLVCGIDLLHLKFQDRPCSSIIQTNRDKRNNRYRGTNTRARSNPKQYHTTTQVQGNNLNTPKKISFPRYSLFRIKVSLWGIKAALFGIQFHYNRNKNFVMVATSLLVKKHEGKTKNKPKIYSMSNCLHQLFDKLLHVFSF